MATIDYKEKYEQALEVAQRFYNNSVAITKKGLEDIFPELKESEGERIRKYILSHLQGHLDTVREFTSKGISSPFSAEEIKMLEASVAWLESQGEQKPADKVEHKFKVGNEINTANEEPLTITKIDEKGYWSEDLFICGFDEECCWDLVEKKSAWSKEDEDNMMMIEDRLSDYLDYIREDTSLTKHQKNSMKEEVIGYVNWLKSLKERYTWKPSEEQIEALNRAMYHVEDDVATQIVKLIGDLKKIKGE